MVIIILGGSDGKESACNAKFNPWVRKISWRREFYWRREPTPGFFPGEFHGWKSLVSYSPWDHKELDTTERIKLDLYQCLLEISVAWSFFSKKASLNCLPDRSVTSSCFPASPSHGLQPGNRRACLSESWSSFHLCSRVLSHVSRTAPARAQDHPFCSRGSLCSKHPCGQTDQG